jgi:hypothetical protein
MTPPTQRHDARSGDERLELTAALANLLSLENHRRVACVAVGLGVAYAGYSALNHAQRNGFRLPVSLLPMLLPLFDAHALKCLRSQEERWEGVHVSLQPPPQCHVKSWVLGCASQSPSSSSLLRTEDDVSADHPSVFLGRGDACHRAAKETLKTLHVCSYGDDHEVVVS